MPNFNFWKPNQSKKGSTLSANITDSGLAPLKGFEYDESGM